MNALLFLLCGESKIQENIFCHRCVWLSILFFLKRCRPILCPCGSHSWWRIWSLPGCSPSAGPCVQTAGHPWEDRQTDRRSQGHMMSEAQTAWNKNPFIALLSNKYNGTLIPRSLLQYFSKQAVIYIRPRGQYCVLWDCLTGRSLCRRGDAHGVGLRDLQAPGGAVEPVTKLLDGVQVGELAFLKALKKQMMII